MLAEGKSDRGIDTTLSVSGHSAANILGKLGVPARAAVVAWAIRHSLTRAAPAPGRVRGRGDSNSRGDDEGAPCARGGA